MASKYFVFGARGVQGAPVARALQRAGHHVVTPTRTAAVADQLRDGGYYPIVLDIGCVEDVLAAMDGCEAAFWHVPTGATAGGSSPSDALIAVLRRRAVPRSVVSTSGIVPRDPAGAAAGFAGVCRLAATLRSLEDSVVTLRPTMFLEDILDTFPLERIRREGILRYPLSIERPIAWVTAAAVGEHAARIMTSSHWSPGWIAVLGACPRSVADIAARLGERLRCPVSAKTWPLDDYAADLARTVGPRSAESTAAIYRVIEDNHEQLESALEDERLVLLGDPLDQWLEIVSAKCE